MNKDQSLFIKAVAFLVKNYGFSNDVANFIGCQFALESNYGNSSLAVKHHNYCGMKFPLIRISLAYHIPNSDFAGYNSMVQCVEDYMLCLNYHRPLSSIKDSIPQFEYFIKKWYCPEKDYINKINFIYNQFKSYKNGN